MVRDKYCTSLKETCLHSKIFRSFVSPSERGFSLQGFHILHKLISFIKIGGSIAYVYWSASSLSSVSPGSWMRPMGQMWPECCWLHTIIITATTSLHIMLHYGWRWV